MEVRACQCSFCRKHNSLAVSDPAGRVRIRVERQSLLERYMFGLRTAEYLICRACGVYVSAVTMGEQELRAIVIVNALQAHRLFTRQPTAADYDAENREDRGMRRRERWTPVAIE
jgi:hypothetical protein